VTKAERRLPNSLASLLDFAHAQPGVVIAIVLIAHMVIWTVVPLLTSPNLQLDLVEGLALGKEWQIGYWKHPPLPWWITDLIYRVTGRVGSVYMLGPIASAVCMLAVWLLAREIVGPLQSLVATLALEGIHFYNYSAVKFAHDQMQLPVWALAALFLYRAIVRGSLVYWILAGIMVALAFWTKYAALALAVSLGLFLLLDPQARQTWRTPGPYLMGFAFALTVAPHAIWLIAHDFGPMIYANARARHAAHWYEYFVFPLRWIGGQFFFLLPALALLAIVLLPARPSSERGLSFAGRYVTMLALGPFLFVTAVSIVAGRLPVLMWGYPLWSFLPLALVIWLGDLTDRARLRPFAAWFLILFFAMPVLYITVSIVDSLRGKAKATDFPGRLIAEQLTEIWHAKVNRPLSFVMGDELAANNVAVFSRDRPHVIFLGWPEHSPWSTREEMVRSGVLFVWDEVGAARTDMWKVAFPDFDVGTSEVLEVPIDGWRQKPPFRIRYVIMPPKG
jgi:4-amino-4-deoxy-L-arabinose transferase-like glycosyltransferase